MIMLVYLIKHIIYIAEIWSRETKHFSIFNFFLAFS